MKQPKPHAADRLPVAPIGSDYGVTTANVGVGSSRKDAKRLSKDVSPSVSMVSSPAPASTDGSCCLVRVTVSPASPPEGSTSWMSTPLDSSVR